MSAATSHALNQKLDLIDLRLLHTGLVWIYEGAIPSDSLIQETLVPEQTAFFICDGGVSITNEYGTASAKAGDWIFPRSGARTHRFEPGTSILSIHFDIAWPGGHRFFEFGRAIVLEGVKIPDLYPAGKRLERLVERFFPNANIRLRYVKSDVETHLLIQGALQEWLFHYVQALRGHGLVPARFGRIDSRALEILQRLDRHPLTTPFQPGRLAKELSFSASQLNRLFGKAFGETPNQYLERRRLEEAVSRLHGSSDPVKQIAFDLGFHSLSHFSAWLRRKTALSPRQLRAEPPRHSLS